jgi:branched-chain amino acid transport system substrate-binding protein
VIAKKVAVILGSSLVSNCSAMMPLVKGGPAMYCLSPGIHPPDGSYAERAIDAAFGEKGPYRTSIVAREHFNPTDLSVSAQMTRIKASRAQALVAWSTGTPAATLLRGVVDVGLNLPVIATSVSAWPGTRR